MKLILALLALAAPLHAAAESRAIEFSFYCLKYVPGLETIRIAKDGGFEEVRLSTANMTQPVRLNVVENTANFYGTTPSTGTQDKLPVAGKVRIPASIDKALVVLVPNAPGSAEPYHSLVIDRSDTNFRPGTYRIVNFSKKSIRGAIGKSYIEAASGGIKDLELKGEPGAVQGVRFEFAHEGRWNRLTETRCAVRKDRRWLLCVYQEPGTERINMRSIPDRSHLLTNLPVSDVASSSDTVSNPN